MSYEPTVYQMARLPKWAREHIRVQAMRLREACDALLRQRGETPSRVQVEPHGAAGGPELYLKDTATVRFQLGDNWQDHIDVHIDRHLHRGHQLMIRACNMLLLHPVSGNHVDITLGD
jgi:hypothetical protein